MSRVPLSPQTVRAVNRYGPQVDHLAEKRYGITGEQLLARLVAGESRDNPNAVSSAGARGRTQFMPTTRSVVLQRYGIDPWKNADQAVHASVLHLLGKLGNARGLEGYNPGSPTYSKYIVGQRTNLGAVERQLGLSGGASARGGGGRPAASAPALPLLSDVLGPASSGVNPLTSRFTPPPVSAPAAPAVDARARLPMPGGALVPESSGPPVPKVGVADLLSAAAGLAPSGSGLASIPGVSAKAARAAGQLPPGQQVQRAGQVESAISHAKHFLGVAEIGSSNRGKQVDRFERRFGSLGQAWCGYFVGTVLQKTGVKGIDARIGSVAAIEQMARSGSGGMKRWLPTAAAQPGDLLITSKGQHVALVTAVKGNQIFTIAGNSGNKVQRVTYTKGSTYGIARPNYRAGGR